MRVAVSVDLGAAVVAAAVREKVEEAAELLIEDGGLERVDVSVDLPRGGLEWALAGTASLLVGLGDLYPACESELTPEIAWRPTSPPRTSTWTRRRASRRSGERRSSKWPRSSSRWTSSCVRRIRTWRSVRRGRCPPRSTGGTSWIELGFEAALGNNGALDHPGQHDRASSGGHPRRSGRRPAGLDADHRAPSCRAAPARPGPDRGAGTTVALGRARGADLRGRSGLFTTASTSTPPTVRTPR